MNQKHEMFRHCKNGNVEKIRELVKNNKDLVNAEDVNRDTCLMHTAPPGWYKAAEVLIENNANLDTQNNLGETALHKAAENSHKDYVRMMIEKGSKCVIKDKKGNSVLHKAAEAHPEKSWETVKILLEYFQKQDASIDLTNDEGNTALHLAANAGKTNVVQILIENNANMLAKDNQKQTVLHKASNFPETLKLLIDFLKNEKTNLIDDVDEENNTALHLASKDDNIHSVKLLIKNGANVEIQNSQSKNALHISAEKGFKAIVAELMQVDKHLLMTQDEEKETPLHVATFHNQIEVVKEILSVRNDDTFLDVRNKRSRNALLVAIKFERIELFNIIRKSNQTCLLFPNEDQDQIISTLKFLQEKSTLNEISLDSNDLLKENVKLDNKTLLEFSVSKGDSWIRVREELICLLQIIEDKKETSKKKSKHNLKMLMKNKLGTSPGLVGCIKSINEKYPRSKTETFVMKLSTILENIFFSLGIWILDVVTDSWFAKEIRKLSETNFLEEFENCEALFNKKMNVTNRFCQHLDQKCQISFEETYGKYQECLIYENEFDKESLMTIYYMTVIHIVLPFAVSFIVFLVMILPDICNDPNPSKTSKFTMALGRYPSPVFTKIKMCLLECKLSNKRYTSEEEKDRKEKEKQRAFVNLSMILEGTFESSFQLWFQTLYFFPVLVFIDRKSYGRLTIVRILSIISSFLAYTFSVVKSRFETCSCLL